MLHLMRKQNAQAGSPMPSIKIIAQQIRRASEYDLPIFGAVFQRSIELDCRDKLIVVKQERQIPCSMLSIGSARRNSAYRSNAASDISRIRAPCFRSVP